MSNTPCFIRTFADTAKTSGTDGDVAGEESSPASEGTEPNGKESESEDAEESSEKKKWEEPYEFSGDTELKAETSTEDTSSESIPIESEAKPAASGGFFSRFKNKLGFKEEREPLPGESEEIGELQARIKDLEKQSNDFKTAALEYKAEVFNVRNRGLKDVENAQKYAIEKFAKEMLVIADNIDLALKNVEKPVPDENNKNFVMLYEGMEMTQKQLGTSFKKFDLVKAESMGIKFDVNMHEVLFQMPGAEGEEGGLIKNVVRDGYWLKGRTLRSAQVGVVQL